MQLNKLDNIIFLKNVESNYIDEAFIVLKENVNFNKINSNTSENNYKINILKEAEFLVNRKLEENDIDFEKYKFINLEKKFKISKLANLILIGLFIIFSIKNFF